MADFLSDAEFDQYRKLIYDESGITFSATNRAILESRLKERLRDKQMDKLGDYYALLMRDKEELKLMLDSVTRITSYNVCYTKLLRPSFLACEAK